MINRNPKSADRKLDQNGRRLILEHLEVRTLLAADASLCVDIPTHNGSGQTQQEIVDDSGLRQTDQENAGKYLADEEAGPGDEIAEGDFPSSSGLIPEGEGPADSPYEASQDAAVSETNQPGSLVGEGEALNPTFDSQPIGPSLGPFLPVAESPAAPSSEQAVANPLVTETGNSNHVSVTPAFELSSEPSTGSLNFAFESGALPGQHEFMVLAAHSQISQLGSESREVYSLIKTFDFSSHLNKPNEQPLSAASSGPLPALRDSRVEDLRYSPIDSVGVSDVASLTLGNQAENGSDLVNQLLRIGGGMIATQVSHQPLVSSESDEPAEAETPSVDVYSVDVYGIEVYGGEIYGRILNYQTEVAEDLKIDAVAIDHPSDAERVPSWLEQSHPLLAALVGATGALIVGVCKQRRYDADQRENFGKLE